MSGSISQPPMAMPQQGAGGGMPQLPPQVLAMLLAAAQQRQGGGGGPMQAQSGGPAQPAIGGPAQAQMPQASPQMPPQQGIPAPIPGGMSNSYPASAAQKGRFGDTMMAHMTPGEIAVPPQVQTPGVLAALQQAFKTAGADVRQFAAGSPYAAHNPDTGQQEFSLWSALLPVVGAIGGSFIPGVGTAAGAALGGAAGGVAGGAIDHTGAPGMLLGGLGGAAGGYLGAGGGLSGLLGSGGGATGAAGAAGSAATNAPLGDAAQSAMAVRMAAGDSPAMIGAGTFPQAAAPSPSLMSLAKTGLSAGMGAGIGQSLAPPSSGSNTPPGFNQPMGPVNPNAMIGGRPAASAPSFAGYNPYTSVTSGSPYRFY